MRLGLVGSFSNSESLENINPEMEGDRNFGIGSKYNGSVRYPIRVSVSSRVCDHQLHQRQSLVSSNHGYVYSVFPVESFDSCDIPL
jgi:hypothetical protein